MSLRSSSTPISSHIAALVNRLRQHAPFRDPYEVHSSGSDGKRAAVAVLLIPSESGDDLDVVLTKRTGSMAWANEVVFPGGKLDASDATLCHCALREADEEIKLFGGALAHQAQSAASTSTSAEDTDSASFLSANFDPEKQPISTDKVDLELLTSLPLHLAKDSLIVSPFVFLMEHSPDFIPVRNPREVAPRGIFRIPLSYFLGPDFKYTVDHMDNGHHGLTTITPPESVKHSVSTSWWKQRKVHYFDVPARIWESDEPEGGVEMHKVTWVGLIRWFVHQGVLWPY